MTMPVISFDVEDWFQVENLRGAISRESWESQERRVVANTRAILRVLDSTATRGTFFCLGWIAQREPSLIREIHAAGHEVASHGYDHRLIYEQDIASFRSDLLRAKDLLEDITGTPVYGYRAPSFSITDDALAVIAETGHRYDSSWFPAQGHDRYGRVDLSKHVVPPINDDVRAISSPEMIPLIEGLVELPIATVRIGRRAIPMGGGGWFRLFPKRVFRAGFRHAMRQGTGGMFYLHPWELDADQPRVAGLRRDYAFRHYVNLQATETRLAELCAHFDFTRAIDVVERYRPV